MIETPYLMHATNTVIVTRVFTSTIYIALLQLVILNSHQAWMNTLIKLRFSNQEIFFLNSRKMSVLNATEFY